MIAATVAGLSSPDKSASHFAGVVPHELVGVPAKLVMEGHLNDALHASRMATGTSTASRPMDVALVSINRSHSHESKESMVSLPNHASLWAEYDEAWFPKLA